MRPSLETVGGPLKRYPLRATGSTTLISTTGRCCTLATVLGEQISAKMMCSSSQAAVVPFGERLGVPSGQTEAIKPSRCSLRTRFISCVNLTFAFSLIVRIPPCLITITPSASQLSLYFTLLHHTGEMD